MSDMPPLYQHKCEVYQVSWNMIRNISFQIYVSEVSPYTESSLPLSSYIEEVQVGHTLYIYGIRIELVFKPKV